MTMTLTLASCAHYRSGSGGFKRPSEYTNGQSALSEIGSYRPRESFKLFWPVKDVRLSRGFRPKNAPRHEGVDLGGKKGLPIRAAHEGIVIYSGRDFRGYGNMVLIEYDRNWATLYAHLHEIHAREGMIVRPGDPLGTMGRTGRATGVHLHFELLHKRQPVDPLPYLARPHHFASQ
ncbi:MAG: M23 family metallopeptidase [Bdellovibrionales bacterium]